MTVDSNKKPLLNQRIILLKRADHLSEFIEKVQRLGANVVTCPLLETRLRPEVNEITPAFIDAFSIIIFASKNAVYYVLNQLKKFTPHPEKLFQSKKIIPVGTKTASTLKKNNIPVFKIPCEERQEGILSLLETDLTNESILLPCAISSRSLLEEMLTQRGAKVVSLSIYESYCPAKPKLTLAAGDNIIFTSPLMASFFFENGLYHGESIHFFCIGEITKTRIQHYYDGPIYVAPHASMDSILDVILLYL